MSLPEINERRVAYVVFSYMGLMLFVGVASEFAQSAALSWLALRLGLVFLWAAYGFVAVIWLAILGGLLHAAFSFAQAAAVRFADSVVDLMQKF
jgi:hypothetical protein